MTIENEGYQLSISIHNINTSTDNYITKNCMKEIKKIKSIRMYSFDLERLKAEAIKDKTTQQKIIEKALWNYYCKNMTEALN